MVEDESQLLVLTELFKSAITYLVFKEPVLQSFIPWVAASTLKQKLVFLEQSNQRLTRQIFLSTF